MLAASAAARRMLEDNLLIAAVWASASRAAKLFFQNDI
jgi:hypothetical protein